MKVYQAFNELFDLDLNVHQYAADLVFVAIVLGRFDLPEEATETEDKHVVNKVKLLAYQEAMEMITEKLLEDYKGQTVINFEDVFMRVNLNFSGHTNVQ